MVDVKWTVPDKNQKVWPYFRRIFRCFFKVKNIVNLNEEGFPQRCILVSNHANKKGPFIYELNLPVHHISWGAYWMLGNYKERYNYLRNILYIQKNGVKPFKATIKAFFEAIFSKYIYKGVKVLPSFPDARLRRTVEYSIQALEQDNAIAVYPEDSSKGYFDEMTHFFPGFVMLADAYRKKTGVDLPIYPIYLGRVKGKRKIVIGKPLYAGKMIDSGLDKKQVADVFRKEVNQLYYDHFNGKKTID